MVHVCMDRTEKMAAVYFTTIPCEPTQPIGTDKAIFLVKFVAVIPRLCMPGFEVF